MTLYSRAVVVVAVVALVLIVLSSFFVLQTGPQVTKAEANRIFASWCQNYAERECPWSVTREEGFDEYLEACRVLHGKEREATSCLYSFCAGCKEISLKDLHCDGLCNVCKANAAAGVGTEVCLAQYDSQCEGTCEI